MTCDQASEWISARIDGELAEVEVAALERHLADCPDCRRQQEAAWALHRRTRLTAAEVAPASTPTAVEALRPPVLHEALRQGLFVIGGVLIALNVTDLFDGDHVMRHDGVFGTALGIAMVAVAFRPYRAIGLVPITSTITALMVIVAITDIVSNRSTMLAEAIHLVEMAGLVCLWILSGGPQRWTRLRQAGLNGTLRRRSSALR